MLLGAADPDADPPLPAAAESARLSGDLKVVSMALSLRPDPQLGDNCKHWKLSEADVRFFFRKAVPITGPEFHALYYVLPCEYAGRMQLGGTTYKFVINGGSYAEIYTLSEPVVVRTYGCRHGCENITPFGEYPAEGEEP